MIARLVDAHHHLWNLDALRYPWLEARGVRRFFGDPSAIQANYLPADLRADAENLPLVASVHVQVGVAPGAELAETTWLHAQAQRTGLPSVIVSYCDLAAVDAQTCLDRQQTFARVRAIRQIVGREPSDDLRTGCARVLDDLTWRANMRSLSARGLAFDLQLTPVQHKKIAAILAAMPELAVAICHCGSPCDQSRAGLASWREGMQRLAELPRSVCKISGFGMFDPNWTRASIQPIVETCVELFGAHRCMFGSNFPVEKLAHGYRSLFAEVAAITAILTSAEREEIFSGTAIRFYRIEASAFAPSSKNC